MNTSKKYADGVIISTCIMLTAWVGIGYMTLSLYVVPVCEELNILRTQFMLVSSLVAGVSAVVNMFLFGPLAKAFGYKKYLLISCLASTIAFVFLATAQGVWFLWIGGVLSGFGMGGINATMVNALIDQWFRKNQQKYISISQTISTAVGVVISVIWGFVIASLGWRIPMWITVAIGAAATVLIQIFYKGTPEEVGVRPMYADESTDNEKSDDGDGIPAKEMYKTKQFYLLAVGFVLVSVVTWAIYNNIALFVTDAGFGSSSGIFLSIAMVAQTVGFAALAPVVDKFGTKWLITVGLGCLIVSSLIYMMKQPVFAILVLAALLAGLCSAACQMPFGAACREAFGSREFEGKVGVVASFAYYGAFIGPIMMTAFYDATGNFRLGQIAVIILAVISAICFFPGTKRVK